MAATLNIFRTKWFERLLIFVNQLYQIKLVKLQNFNILSSLTKFTDNNTEVVNHGIIEIFF